MLLQTMQEFDALKIAKVSSISSYEKSERKIKLNDEYSWFFTEEFKNLQAIRTINNYLLLTTI